MTDSLRAYVLRSPLNGILFFLLLIFAGTSVSSFIGFVISQLFFGIPLLSQPALLEDMSNPELISAFRTMQLVQGVGMLIVPSVIYLWISSSWITVKALFGSLTRQSVMISIAFFMVAFPLVNYLADWNAGWNLPTFLGDWLEVKEFQAGVMTKLFLDMPNLGLLILNLVMIALLPAIGEELIFRGILQRGLQKIVNPHLAIWLSAMLFSAVHMQFLGFVPRVLMGVGMGYLFFWSGNLWYPIVAHFTNNALAVGMAYGIQHHLIHPNLESAGTDNISLAGFSLMFCLMILYLFKQFQQT
ncbi:MAG: CPBP family intramembrane metalloprotease, partial [Flavobacteriales bacterium]|nr:CPBP family intramembrane metalloprotease [Flavobacteriales bacterium]